MQGLGNFAPFLHKIGCHGNVPWDIEKRGPDRSSTAKKLSFDVKIAIIGPADLQIICLLEIIKKDKKEEEKKEITDGKRYSPSGKFAERAK